MPYGVCKVCGCTDNDPCHNPDYGNCWWVDDTHELCSHCADPEIAEDPATVHCINSSDDFLLSLEEELACCHCKRWQKCKDSDDVKDEDAYGDCHIYEWGSYGSDPACVFFEEKEDSL